MSVFRVALQSTEQGQLDTTGDPSLQRQVFVTGPNLTQRLMSDGETFTDCNYWKRYAYPQIALAHAFIEVVTDDGSIYSDNPDENTYPQMTTITAVGGTTFAANEYDILGTLGGHAVFTQITNGGAGSVQVRLNGLTGATFTLDAAATQIYNNGDLVVTKIQIDNSASGAADADVDVQVSVRSVCDS